MSPPVPRTSGHRSHAGGQRLPASESAAPPATQPVTVGRITAPHGVRGELKVEPMTDFPERFEHGSRLWLRGEQRTVERGRWAGRALILKLEGIETRNDAEALRGEALTVPEPAELVEEGVYYLHDIIGLAVADEAGEALGHLANVFNTGSADVYVVRGERGELLLPALDDVITEVNIAEGRIVVHVPEGLEFHRLTGTHRSARRVPQPGNRD